MTKTEKALYDLCDQVIADLCTYGYISGMVDVYAKNLKNLLEKCEKEEGEKLNER